MIKTYRARPTFARRDVRSRPDKAILTALLVSFATLGLSSHATPAASAEASDAFKIVNEPGGGTILAGPLGSGSLPEATAALMRRIHARFHARPTIESVARSASGDGLALNFRETMNGKPYTGLAIVTAPTGSPIGGAALYDTTARFPATVKSLMRQLETLTNSSGNGSLAPAAPLVTHPFGDGTGSIGIPAGWKLVVGGGGSAFAIGPAGELVQYSMHYTALDPTTPRARMYLKMESPQLLHAIEQRTAILAYTSDPIRAFETIDAQLSKQNGGFTPRYEIARSSKPGPNVADVSGTALGAHPFFFTAHIVDTPPNPNGGWGVTKFIVMVPAGRVTQTLATASAVLASVKIDFGAVAAIDRQIDDSYAAKFNQEIANDRAQDRARQQNTDDFLANDRAAQEGMHKQAVAMENYSLDRAVVVDQRGVHRTVDSGFADTLVRENSNYRKVPAGQLLRGIDY